MVELLRQAGVEADQGAVSDRIRQDPSSDRSIAVKADQGSITITYATP